MQPLCNCIVGGSLTLTNYSGLEESSPRRQLGPLPRLALYCVLILQEFVAMCVVCITVLLQDQHTWSSTCQLLHGAASFPSGGGDMGW